MDISVAYDTIDVLPVKIPVQSVEVIVAQIGLDFRSEGWNSIWVRNILIADGKTYVSSDHPHQNAANYERWLAKCPQAVGIMTDGTLRLPYLGENEKKNPVSTLRDALSKGKRILGSYLARMFAMWAALFIPGTIDIAVVLTYYVAHRYAIQFTMGGLVLAVASLLPGVHALTLVPQWWRITRVLSKLNVKGEIQPDLLAKIAVQRRLVQS